MGECLSTLKQIADDVVGLRAEAGISIGGSLEPTGAELLTVAEAAEILGIGRTTAYEAARRVEIPSLRLGRRVLVPKRTLSRLLGEGQQRGT